MQTLESEKEFNPTRKIIHISALLPWLWMWWAEECSSLQELPASSATRPPASLPLQGCWDSVQLRARACPGGEKNPWRSDMCPLVPHTAALRNTPSFAAPHILPQSPHGEWHSPPTTCCPARPSPKCPDIPQGYLFEKLGDVDGAGAAGRAGSSDSPGCSDSCVPKPPTCSCGSKQHP